jgi:hypothetical protein
MYSITKETRSRWEGETTAMRRVDGAEAESKGVVEEKVRQNGAERWRIDKRLIDERCLVEKLLLYEVEVWEGLLWNRVKEFIARNDVPKPGKEQLTREWRGNCWKRLNANILALDARMEAAKAGPELSSHELQHIKLEDAHKEIRGAWQSVVERMVDTMTSSTSSTGTPGYRFNKDVQEDAKLIGILKRSVYGTN